LPMMPSWLTRCWVGASPTALALRAGCRIEPPVSSPMEQVTRLAPTEEPEPPLELPGDLVVSYGLHIVPPNELRERCEPPSPRFAFARMIAPAARSFAMKCASSGGRSLAKA